MPGSDDRPPASAPAPLDARDPGAADWPAQAADTIVDVVGTVRDKTTGPALTVARGVVYGLLILGVAVMTGVLVVVGLIRLLDNWLPTWAVYAVLGAVFVVAGGMLWRQRAPKGSPGPGLGNPAPGPTG